MVDMEIQRLALSFAHPLFFPYARFDIAGVENIPASRTGDHRRQPSQLLRSGDDGSLIGRTDRTVRFLGKKEVFDVPIVGQIAAAMGGIRVDRGTGSDEPLKAAAGRSSGRAWWRSCRRERSPAARRSSIRD